MTNSHRLEEFKLELLGGKFMVRDWRMKDASSLAKYADNLKVWLNLRDGFPHPYHHSDAVAFLTRVAGQRPRTFFAIASPDEAIGGIGLSIGEDVHRFTAEMGYWLAEPFWNRGIMTEAIRKLTDEAFSRFGLNRIFAEPYATNPASARVLEKAGFEREGLLRANVVKDGRILDQWLFSRINPDPLKM